MIVLILYSLAKMRLPFPSLLGNIGRYLEQKGLKVDLERVAAKVELMRVML